MSVCAASGYVLKNVKENSNDNCCIFKDVSVSLVTFYWCVCVDVVVVVCVCVGGGGDLFVSF